MSTKLVIQSVLAVVLLVCTAHALDIEMVPVGNLGNAPDTRYWPKECGAVDYEYRIGKYEVTAGQYCEFLNAVAATDTFCLYNTLMGSHPHGCQIQRSGTSGNYAYSVAADWANRPVNIVSWGDAARFCNWLHNGQPSGAQDLTTTEDGAYFLIGGTTAGELGEVVRESDWKWAIPTEDEWYKAAYYDPAASAYYEYPTSSDTEPGYVKDNGYITGTLTVFVDGGTDPGNNATYYGEGGAMGIGLPYYRTEVGEWENSGSPYGTFDQGGNVNEWNETGAPWGGTVRGFEGGSYTGLASFMCAKYSNCQTNVTTEGEGSGFRVVCIAEPVIPILGDLNDDGMVGSADLDIIRANWGAEVEPGEIERGDATGDGYVNSADLDIIRADWGAETTAVPEPGVLFLSIGGTVLCLRRRRGRKRCFACAVAVTALFIAGSAQADVFNMGGTRNADGSWNGVASLETVPVGNPGNPADDTGYGNVAYEYNIGRYEVTTAQYVEFLNAVAASDPYGLYNADMWSDSYPHGCKIQQMGSSGSYTYSVSADRANRPVDWVSWDDAARFCNWLTTGDTETGVYTFTGSSLVRILDHETAAKTLGRSAWFIPTEDEWYKAAYHKNDGATGYYWDYPTGTNSTPSNDLISPDPGNNANFRRVSNYTIGSPYYTTEVGEFENSESPYGTFDQGGNLWEWNETIVSGSSRGLRGGSWYYGYNDLEASDRLIGYPVTGMGNISFRVADIPGPPIMGDLDGDLNDDGLVNSRDLDLVRSWWGEEVEPGRGDRGDATGDGLVNSRDLDIVRANWGAGTAAVPEPGVVFLLISGAALLGWRRRRGRSCLQFIGLQGGRVVLRLADSLVVLVCVVMLFSTSRADFALLGTQHLDVTSFHSVGSLYQQSTADVEADGGITEAYVNDEALLQVLAGSVEQCYAHDNSSVVISGGTIQQAMEAYESSSVSISGGSINNGLTAYDNSNVGISGGNIKERSCANDTASVVISGGTIEDLYAYDTSSVDVSGGTVRGFLYAWESSSMHISDGTVQYLGAFGTSSVDISGGTVKTVNPGGTSSVNISGGTMEYDMQARESSSVVISGGTIKDLSASQNSRVDISSGTVSNNVEAYDTGSINISGDTNCENHLYANGTSRVDMSGGTINGTCYAHDTSSINISGGTINGNLYAYEDSSVDISSGTMRYDVEAYASSNMDISGGSINGSLKAYNSSSVVISGGSINGELSTCYDDSSLVISGGTINRLDAYDTSSVNISAGTINNSLYAWGSGSVTISGGTVNDSLYASESSSVNISGGTVENLYAFKTGSVTISGGTINNGLTTFDSRNVNISGGSINNDLTTYDSSNVNISGGSVFALNAHDNTTVTLHGYGFYSLGGDLSLEGELVLGTGLLGGNWADGTPWTLNILENGPDATIRTHNFIGDLDGDGYVGSADLDIVRANWGAEVEPGETGRGDATGDGLVNSADLDIVRANWGNTATAAVPEPGGIFLALAGGVWLAFRRRH